MARSARWVYPRGLIDPRGEVELPTSPLRLYEKRVWDPAEQYWGESDGMLEMCLVEVIAAGPRLEFEFEQLLPSGEDPDASDPILDAIELRDHGYPDRARALLNGLIEWDARCIDAHAHLGGLAFEQDDPAAAQAHYATGVRIAECSLPEDFGGVLGWGWIDNRPFLRCLHGLTLSTWRLEQFTEAHEMCWALLWLNPADNHEARALLPDIAAGAPLARAALTRARRTDVCIPLAVAKAGRRCVGSGSAVGDTHDDTSRFRYRPQCRTGVAEGPSASPTSAVRRDQAAQRVGDLRRSRSQTGTCQVD